MNKETEIFINRCFYFFFNTVSWASMGVWAILAIDSIKYITEPVGTYALVLALTFLIVSYQSANQANGFWDEIGKNLEDKQ